MTFLSKHNTLYALGRPKWILDIIWPLNQHFELKTQRNWLKQVWMLKFCDVINCILCTHQRNLLLSDLTQYCFNTMKKSLVVFSQDYFILYNLIIAWRLLDQKCKSCNLLMYGSFKISFVPTALPKVMLRSSRKAFNFRWLKKAWHSTWLTAGVTVPVSKMSFTCPAKEL